MMKRITAVMLAMIFVLMLVPNLAFAMDLDSSSLTVVVKYDDLPLKGINVAICRVADAKEENGKIVYTATQEFSGAGADYMDLTEDKNAALAAVLDAYAYVGGIRMTAKVTDSSGKAFFTDLPAGMYLVTQRDGENSQYAIAPYLAAIPRINTAGNGCDHDVISYPKTELVKPEEEHISVDVFKIWKGTNNPPASIKAQLYRNSKPYGSTVTLNAGNYWRYTWDNLDPGYKWTVDETSVPPGYKKKVSGNVSTGFIITNTKGSGEPSDPDGTPGDGSGGGNGGTGGGNGGGGTGGTGEEAGGGDGSGGGEGGEGGGGSGGGGDGSGDESGKGPGTPKTWDASNTPLWFAMSAISIAGMLFLVLRLRAMGRILSGPRAQKEGSSV